MKFEIKKTSLILFILEGLGAIIYYFSFHAESGSARLFHQSTPRLLLAALLFLIILLAGAALISLFTRRESAQDLSARIDRVLVGENSKLHLVQLIFFCVFIAAVEGFFLTFISFPPFMRPITLWLAAASLQAWIFLRITYKAQYTSWRSSIQTKWRSYSPTQHRVFLVLSIIGLVYFCIFIPLNSLGWNDPSRNFMSGVDEGIQYPIAVQTLTTGDTFASTVYHVMVNESDVYGHPYVTLESLILLPSRLIYGPTFGDQVQLNLFLLRQFINVLPIVLSMFLLVYLFTRFRSMWQSIALFILLLTIPGVVKFNIRFLHPDSLILLLIVLTIFFLQRDQFRFKKNFYLAAVTCSLAAVIKLWGFFFFLAILVYLLYGLIRKSLTFRQMALAGTGFILVMIVTGLLSNPGLLVPTVFKELIAGLTGQITNRTVGYADLGSNTIYNKDFATWMTFFQTFYLRDFYFYISSACLILASFWGKNRLHALMTLMWCLVVLVFMVNFLAAKSYWYMMELLVPLYPAPFLLPALVTEIKSPAQPKIINNPLITRVLWGGVILLCGSQFVINLITIATSPLILNYAR